VIRVQDTSPVGRNGHRVGKHIRYFDQASSEDGKLLASASADGTAKVWNIATGELLLTLDMSPVVVGYVTFSHDSKYLITANWDNTIRLH
jgi:WD40 repeat protein